MSELVAAHDERFVSSRFEGTNWQISGGKEGALHSEVKTKGKVKKRRRIKMRRTFIKWLFWVGNDLKIIIYLHAFSG